VLLVSRNQQDAMRRTLESLAPYAATGVEVLVVDNASSDGSARADSEFPFVKMLRMQRNFGWTKAINVGARTAQGEYLLLTPPGIEFGPDTIPRLVEASQSETAAGAVAPLAVDAQGTPVTRSYPLPSRETLWQFWRTGSTGKPLSLDRSQPVIVATYLTGSPLLIRRQAIAGMNYLDEKYGHFWADAEFAFQIQRAGKRIHLLPDVQVKALPPYLPIPERLDGAAALLAADAVNGACVYLAKREGSFSALRFRIAAVVTSLGGLFVFRQWGARAMRFWSIATGQKIDGTQGV
jgi:N-acetylglucosaminyl-diphospho-decaprenol L-rhamnosyltransferase